LQASFQEGGEGDNWKKELVEEQCRGKQASGKKRHTMNCRRFIVFGYEERRGRARKKGSGQEEKKKDFRGRRGGRLGKDQLG